MSSRQEDDSVNRAFDDSRRLEVLQSYNILDADLSDRLNRFTDLAARACDVPVAMFQLLDGSRQVVKASSGWDVQTLDREASLADYTLLQDEMVVIQNIGKDGNVKERPVLELKPGLRFYAGVPVTSKEGYTLGVFSIFDIKARTLTGRQRESLKLIAEEVAAQLEYYRREKATEEEAAKNSIFLRDSITLQAIIEPGSGEILDINTEAAGLLGGEREDFIGQPFGGNLADEEVLREIKDLLGQERVKKAQFHAPVRIATGDILNFELTFNLHELEFSRHGYVWYLTARDRTEKINYEKELLKRSEAIEASQEGIAILDDEGIFTYLNQAHVEIFGYEEKEKLVNEKWEKLYPDDIVKQLEEEVLPVLEEQGEWKGETTGLRKDDKRFPVEFSLKVISEEEIVAVVRDITERKNTEMKLRETLDRLEHAQHIAKLGSWKWELGSGNIQWSPETYDIFEYDSETVDPDLDDFLNIIHPRDIDKVREVIGEIRSGMRPRDLRHRIITPRGNLKHVHLRAVSYMSKEEGTTVLLGTTQDITEQVRIEKELRKSLEEKEVLLAEVHHRVKNNLAVISGLLQLESFQAEQEEVRQVLTKSQMRIHSMATIHEKLYQHGDFNKVPFDSYIRDIVEAIKRSYQEKAAVISLRTSLDEIRLNVNQAVPCGLIINELIVNAYKHAFKEQKQGRIFVELKEHNNTVRLTVKDNGIGLPDEFEIEKESSLGLTLIRTLCKQLNAQMEMHTNGGSCFEVSFEKAESKGSSSAFSLNQKHMQ